VRSDIVVQYSDDPWAGTQTDAKVMNVVEKVSAHRLQTRALQEVQAGNIAGATVKLRAAATRLLNMGEDELAQAALQEAENLERQGQLSAAGTKKLRYETRKLTQKLT
jgi:Ca-activated chloride channel family protein